MKRVSIIITTIILLLICNYSVNAKDTLYSINKYKEENLDFIEASYNKNGKKDGLIVGGSYLENKKENNTLLVKYDYNGEKKWQYFNETNLNYLSYTYNESGIIDGYLLAVSKLEKNNETTNQKFLFLKVDLSGNLVFEKETNINNCTSINKISPTYNENSEFDGYVVIANYSSDKSLNNATIIKYDKEYNITWKKDREAEDNQKFTYTDLINLYKDNKVTDYIVIEVEEKQQEKYVKLIKFNKSGESVILKDSLEKYESYSLEEKEDGYILYGLTKDVKVKKGDFSYYIINYDSNNNELWESIGEIPVSNNTKLTLQKINKDNEYLLLYQNNSDSSIEVVKLDKDGLVESKIKKINNEYYTINNFYSNKDVLYFIGSLSCPEDDSCNYKTKSLFLVSTEDKVIEVEDNDTDKVLITGVTLLLLIVGVFIFQKKRRLANKN